MAHALPDPTNAGNKPGEGPLRAGGQALDSLTPKTGDELPSTLSASAKRQVPALEMVRDMWTGTEAMHAAGPKYLPQAPGEDGQNYNTRLDRSVWWNFYRRTVQGLVGLIFRKDPVLGEDVPAQIAEHYENIDLAGTHGDVFLRELEEDAMNAGHAAILVDFPNTGGRQFRDVEMIGAVRPYWVPIRKDDILSWRTEKRDGSVILTQIVIRESAMVPRGEFGEAEQVRYRVLYRDEAGVHFRLLAVLKNNAVIEVDAGDYPTQDVIPIAEVATSGRLGLFESAPPLIDVAWLNLAHYQTWSDYLTCIHKTNVPLLFGAGMEPGVAEDGTQLPAVVVGPNTFLQSPNPDAKLAYVSHDGAALGSTAKALEEIVSAIGSLGLSMLAPQKRAAETAEAKRLDKSQGDSALSVSARALQDAVEVALGFHAKYLRLDGGGSVTINRDFEGMAMDPAAMNAFAALIREGYPVRPALKSLQAGGRVPDDEDIEALEMEWLAGAAAAAEQKRQEDAARVAAMTGGDDEEADVE